MVTADWAFGVTDLSQSQTSIVLFSTLKGTTETVVTVVTTGRKPR